MGGHDEREQTLNQILTEMDGFTGTEHVIVLGATNRPEILDPALLRPGRFDRRLTISPPDQAGRRQILDVHVRGVPLALDVDLDAVAAATPGMVGAELANLVNEAALTAARRNHTAVHQADFTDALEKIVLGSERRILLSAEDRRRTAYHEAGHALLGMLTPAPTRSARSRSCPAATPSGSPSSPPTPTATPTAPATCAGASPGCWPAGPPRSSSTTTSPPAPRTTSSRPPASPSRWSGAGACPRRWGCCRRCPTHGASSPSAWGATAPRRRPELVETEARRILDQGYDQALQTLRANRHRLDTLVEALLRTETLDAADAYRAAGVPYPAEPDLPTQAPDVVHR